MGSSGRVIEVEMQAAGEGNGGVAAASTPAGVAKPKPDPVAAERKQAYLEAQEAEIGRPTELGMENDSCPCANPIDIFLLVLCSPLWLPIVILVGVVWLLLLPFRSCMHRHPHSAFIKPSRPGLLNNVKDVENGMNDAHKHGDWFQSDSSGLWIYHRTYSPVLVGGQLPRGIIFVSHGFGEHSSRNGYLALFARLNAAGFLVHALDHQGHGYSTGERAYFERLKYVVKDLLQLVREMDGNESLYKYDRNVPRFIFGHSMGGLIALSAAQETTTPAYRTRYPGAIPLSGVILSAPCLAVDPALATPPLKLAARVLSAIVPKLVLAGLPPTLLSRNPEAVVAYDRDRLIFKGGARARVGAEMLSEMARLKALLPTFPLPVLLLHGTADRVVPLDASATVFHLVSSSDKKLIRYYGAFHELFEEELGERYFRDILSWILQRTQPTKPDPQAAAATSAISNGRGSAQKATSNGEASREPSMLHVYAEQPQPQPPSREPSVLRISHEQE